VGTVVDGFGKIVGAGGPVPSVPGEMSVFGEVAALRSRLGTAINRHQVIDPQVLRDLAIDPKFDAIVQIWLDPGDVGTSYNFSEVVMQRDEIPPPPLPPTPPPPPPPKVIPWDSPSTRYLAPPTAVNRQAMETYGSSGAFTWHLSVINAGQPRSNSAQQGFYDPSDPFFNPESWSGVDLAQAEWITVDSQGIQAKKASFGSANATPLTGDFNGDGVDEVCVFVAGHWFIDLNGNGVWDEGDFWAKLGDEYDFPVVGDWDGDGKADIGIFGPAWLGDGRVVRTEPGLPDAANDKAALQTTDQLVRYKNVPPEPEEAAQKMRSMKRTAQGSVRSDLIDHVFYYGTAGEIPVAGDWNGDGVDNIGVFRQGTWILDTDGNGRLTDEDTRVELGQAGDIPLVGDFNRDGIDDLGVYRQGKWLLDTDGNRRLDAHDKVFELGGPNDKPAVGDFNGDGVDEIVIYRSAEPSGQMPAPAAAVSK
jgi:hypothetical protein